MVIQANNAPEKNLLDIHSVLARACNDKNHNMRFFTLSTSDLATGESSSRIVVFRKLVDEWTIRFYTDCRSSKISEIKNNPLCSILFWDSRKSLQIRIKAEALIHHLNDITEKEWENIQGDAVKSYSSAVKPGKVIESSKEAHDRYEKPDHTFFSVVDCVPYRIKVLQLNRNEHLSLLYRRESLFKPWIGNWIAP